jgi:hypothetical protein
MRLWSDMTVPSRKPNVAITRRKHCGASNSSVAEDELRSKDRCIARRWQQSGVFDGYANKTKEKIQNGKLFNVHAGCFRKSIYL